MIDLVPLLSFAALRGRCRSCAVAIPRRYPVIEAGCAFIGVWAVLAHPGPLGLATAVLGGSLLAIAVIDAEHYWLPDRLTLPLLTLGLAVNAFLRILFFVSAVMGAAIGWLSLSGVALIYRRVRGREGLGGGDARLLAAAGAWVGWAGLPNVLLWASSAGLGVVGAGWLAGRRVLGPDALPFGTFLALGTWLVWVYGETKP